MENIKVINTTTNIGDLTEVKRVFHESSPITKVITALMCHTNPRIIAGSALNYDLHEGGDVLYVLKNGRIGHSRMGIGSRGTKTISSILSIEVVDGGLIYAKSSMGITVPPANSVEELVTHMEKVNSGIWFDEDKIESIIVFKEQLVTINDAWATVDGITNTIELTDNIELKKILSTILNGRSVTVINDHDPDGQGYDVRENMIYVLNNGKIGFGVRDKIHCINQMYVDSKNGNVHVGRMSISGNVYLPNNTTESLEMALNDLNDSVTFDGIKVKEVILLIK